MEARVSILFYCTTLKYEKPGETEEKQQSIPGL